MFFAGFNYEFVGEEMIAEKDINVNKPLDWPQNQREARLSNIEYALKKFNAEPNYERKEVLLSLIAEIDPNQYDAFGTMRISYYEVLLINKLYIWAKAINLPDLILHLYKEITETTRYFNMFSKMNIGIGESFDLNRYSGLLPPLKLYFIAYRNYNYYKSRSFCEELLNTINGLETLEKDGEISLDDIKNDYVTLMYDLSNASGVNTIPVIEFERDELISLFEKEFEIVRKAGDNPNIRPLKGVLKMTIANWILRSRNNYDHSPVFKCLTNVASNSSVHNKEVWMQSISFLNDKREGKAIKEIFANKKWINYDWAKKVVINNPYTFYVTSFTRIKPTEKLKHEYGKNVYGYRSDKIATIIAPLIINKGSVKFSQTLSFDVLYDRAAAKDELNFLFQIIDLMPISNTEKIAFANEIISYWCLSFKDKKWHDENERRYQIFYYKDYSYFDLRRDERFIKIKSSLFLYPDNVSSDNNQFAIIKSNIRERYCAIATKKFVQCNDCLNIDYEIYSADKPYICPVCGSTSSITIDPIELRKNGI